MVILLSEALKKLHSGAVCSLTYITADRKRGTGGQIVHQAACCIYNNNHHSPHHTLVPPVPASHPNNHTGQKMKTLAAAVLQTKNPHHHANKTRNIYIPKTKEIKTIHIKLITQFNGCKVLL